MDHARRAWLAGLAREHATAGSASSALALARGEWMCGEYDDAMAHFLEARDRAPRAPEPHVALVRAASMLGMVEAEREALQAALARHPEHPELRLHAALRLVPGDINAARRPLQAVLHDPLCAQFDAALAAIESGELPAQPAMGTDPRQAARLESLRWVMRHTHIAQVHTGLPTSVLERALDAAMQGGLTLECGVYFGRSLRLIAAKTPGPVHGFDSFQGLPEAWHDNEPAGAYTTAGRVPGIADNVTLHAGWFQDTLPPFFAHHSGPIRLLHVDCDLYSSTRTVLEHAYAGLVPGSLLVFDDFLGYPGYEQHEFRAFGEFASARKVGWELVAACLMGREVAIRITSR